jgi:ferrous iron transport protein A
MTTTSKRLGELGKGIKALIVSVGKETVESELSRRLLEMGLLDGAQVEIVHEAPFGGDPVAVRVRGALIALRRSEANLIEVVENERS